MIERILLLLKFISFVIVFFLPMLAIAESGSGPGTSGVSLPALTLSFGDGQAPNDMVGVVKIVMMLTVLSLAPAILIMMTSFTRIVIVLSFLRQSLGTQQMPPNQLIIGLALFLSFFVMAPTWKAVTENAVQPYLENQIDQQTALHRAEAPIREFMFSQTREKDLRLFLSLTKQEKPRTRADVPTYVLIPSFIISELKTAFQIGFMLYLPFLVLDMVVASILMAMGMMMLPPMMISLPFKLLIFVMVDGWELVVGSLIKSFG
jgi:flagellar biosynthesis protein FliP